MKKRRKRKLTPLKKVEFDSRAITYIREELSRGKTLLTHLLNLPLENGTVTAFLPETVNPEIIYNFRTGGVGLGTVTEWKLPSVVSEYLGESGRPYVVLEHALARSSDPGVQARKHQFFTYGPEVYYFLSSRDRDLAKVETTIKAARAVYYNIGILTSLPEGELDISIRQNVTEHTLEILAKRAKCNAGGFLDTVIREYYRTVEARKHEQETPQVQCRVQVRHSDGGAAWGEEHRADLS